MKLRRIVYLVLTFLMILSTVVYAGNNNYDGDNPFWTASDEDWIAYKESQGLGQEVVKSITTENGSTVLFNRELWEEKGIVVYGDYSIVANNDKKPLAGGYYNGGEYRFHGYDISGNKHDNTDFPPEQEATVGVEAMNWVYRPWNSNSIGYRIHQKYVGKESIYNRTATDKKRNDYLDSDKLAVAKWINDSQNWNIRRIYKNESDGNTDFANFLSIQTAPTPYKSGQGTMVHIDRTGNDWYHTFSVPQIEQKQMTPITAEIVSMAVANINEDGDITLTVQVTGKIEDDNYYRDPILKTAWYTRYDIKNWDFELSDSINGVKIEKRGQRISADKGAAEFQVTLKKSDYKSLLNDSKFQVYFEATAKSNFTNGKNNMGSALNSKELTGTDAVEEPEIIMPNPPFNPILFEVNAPLEILDVWNFNINVNVIDDSHAISDYVELNGRRLVGTEKERFLSGRYKFPVIGEDRIYDYTVGYVHEDGSQYYYHAFVIVYDSKPRASLIINSPSKVNRKITAIGDYSITSNFLLAHSNVSITSFTLTSLDGSKIYVGTDASSMKEFLLKEEGRVRISVRVGNEYGSRNYSAVVYEGLDYEPDIFANVWNSVMSRLDKVDMLAEGNSFDGDVVASLSYDIRYDSDNDGIGDQVVDSGVWSNSVEYKPKKLGRYFITLKATEKFGQPTIPQFIKASDYKTATLVREFRVENLIPMTKLYSNIEFNFPKIDIAFLTDENISREDNKYFKENNVNITNKFRYNSMVANVDLWDLHTYIDRHQAVDWKSTTNVEPPTTLAYNKNGYTGILNRIDPIEDTPRTVDEGQFKYKTLTKTVTMHKDSAWEVGSPTKEYYPDGSLKYIEHTYKASYSYSDSEGYSGSGTATGNSWTSYDKDGKSHSGGTNQPSITGTATKSHRYWDSNYVTYHDYKATYKGEVSKPFKQNYKPDYDNSSMKYIAYITDNQINNISDVNTVKNIAREASSILVANTSLKGKLSENTFISNTHSFDSIIDEIVKKAKNENPFINERTVLIDESFVINSSDIDAEGDPVINLGYQFIHNPKIFDNDLGLEEKTYKQYAENQYSQEILTSFSKPGEYMVYHKIKDMPVNFEELSYESNLAELKIIAHRKPIAKAELDWTFNNEEGCYRTTWVDLSYDPDFEFSDPENQKGLRDRKIKYRQIGSEIWTYEIPDKLKSGEYELEYIVKDNYGVWSDPFVMNFNLSQIPPPQIKAKLKSQSSDFSLSSIPASENLLAYEIWTRYPFELKLELALYDKKTGARVSDVKTVDEAIGIKSKSNQDIYWKDIVFNIPATVKSGDYILKISTVNTQHADWKTTLDFDVRVYTPINLSAYIDGKTENCKIKTKRENIVSADTSKYVNTDYSGSKVKVKIFGNNKVLTYQNILGINKQWQYKWYQNVYTIGMYNAQFTATLPSGESETITLPFELINNTPPIVVDTTKVVTDIGDSYIYEDDNVVAKIKVDDEDKTELNVNIKLINLANDLEIYKTDKKVMPIGDEYAEISELLKEDIAKGKYKLVVTVKDDFDEIAIMEIPFEVHDLDLISTVDHTDGWKENIKKWNLKYPSKKREDNVYWSSEAFNVKSSTTVINANSSIECSKVEIYIIDSKHNDIRKQYLDTLSAENILKNKWSLLYLSDVGMNQWGRNEAEEITLRFKAYYSNGRIEKDDQVVIINETEPFDKLHRTW